MPSAWNSADRTILRHAGDRRGTLVRPIERRLMPGRVEGRRLLHKQRPALRVQLHGALQHGIRKHRREVHLLVDRRKAVIGGDHEGRLVGETGLAHRVHQDAHRVVRRRQRGVRAVVRRPQLVLHFVGEQKVDRQQRRLARLDHVRGRLGEHVVGGAHQERVAVVAEVVVDGNAGAPQLIEHRRGHRGDVGLALRGEHFRDVEVDGRVVLRFGPEKCRRRQAPAPGDIKQRRHLHAGRAIQVGDVKALAGHPVRHPVVDHAVTERPHARQQRRVRRVRDAGKDRLAAGGFDAGRGQRADRRQVDGGVLQMKVREPVDGDEHHMAA